MNIPCFNIRKILIVARGGIGNVLLFTPTLRTLKKSLPGSDIYIMVTSNEAHELLSNNSDIKEVITYNHENKGVVELLKFFMNLRRMRFELAIVMYPGGLRSALWSFLSGAKSRIGYDIPLLRGLGRILYTNLIKVNDELHDIEQNLNILRNLDKNIDLKNKSLVLKLNSAENKYCNEILESNNLSSKDMLISIHPGSTKMHTSKRWKSEYFAELGNSLTCKLNAVVLILGDSAELDIAKKISDLMKYKPVILTGKTTISQAAALISRSRLFIGNDSGLMHIAAAVKVPVVCLIGPTLPKRTGPHGTRFTIVKSNLPCSPCYDYNATQINKCYRSHKYECMSLIKPEDVYNSAIKIIQDGAGN